MKQLELLGSTDGALLDEARSYRYLLWRGRSKPVAWIMLNPSTADEHEDDATIRRCRGFAKRWGRKGIIVANLFAWRAADPKALRNVVDPVGPENDRYILEAAERAEGLIVCAWGAGGELHGRAAYVLKMLREAGYHPKCLGLTKDGHPKHPVRLANATPLVPLRERKLSPEQADTLRGIAECVGRGLNGFIPHGPGQFSTVTALCRKGLAEYVTHGGCECGEHDDAERPMYAVTEAGRAELVRQEGKRC